MSEIIDDVLQSMSLVEKVGQLTSASARKDVTTGVHGDVHCGGGEAIEDRIRRGEVGCLGAILDLAYLEELQRIAVEESPRGIPLLVASDVLHGFRTIFPIPLGLACAWDPELLCRSAAVGATEAASHGISLAWAPMLDVSRDARWGRAAESPGEDPVLGAAFARAMVEGYHKEDLSRPDSVMATAKHFAGYGLSEAGRDYNAVDVSPYRMHNLVLPPFRAAVDAGVGAVMVGFHDLAGIPCSAHGELLRELLRERWGFEGVIVSDHTAIAELVNHGVAADSKEAAFMAFSAGIDLELASGLYRRHLPELVAEGRIAEGEVEAACRRVFEGQGKARPVREALPRLRPGPSRGRHLDRREPASGTGSGREVLRAS